MIRLRKVLLPLTVVMLSGIAGRQEAHAETVSLKQSRTMAQMFFNEAAGRVQAPVKMVYNGRRLTTDRLFVPFYVYNQPAGGFVIIPADNKAFPILGYSLTESFDPDNLGEIEKALLASYAHEIEMIRYDSTEPVEAIAAWQDFPTFVSRLLAAPYDATDPSLTPEEAAAAVRRMSADEEAVEYSSTLYTPSQWQELVDLCLKGEGCFPLGILDNRGTPRAAINHGHKGDYYRMELDRRNSWLMRLNATEVIASRTLADFSVIRPAVEEELPEEPAFVDADLFMAETAAVEENRLLERRMNLEVTEPQVKGLGGGHFEIILPEPATMVTVYTLSGGIAGRQTYAGNRSVFVDISAEPSGFYFALIEGASGRGYGVKLIR